MKKWFKPIILLFGLLFILSGQRVSAAGQSSVYFYCPPSKLSITDENGNYVKDTRNRAIQKTSINLSAIATQMSLQDGKTYTYQLYDKKTDVLIGSGTFTTDDFDVVLNKKTLRLNSYTFECGIGAEGFTVSLLDSDANEVPFSEAAAVKKGDFYSSICYILKSGDTYTYKIASFKAKEADMKVVKQAGSIWFDPAKSIGTKKIPVNMEKTQTLNVRLPKGANAKAYQHLFRAYRQMEDVSIPKQEDGEYETYQIDCAAQNEIILVAGGEGTAYKKTAVQITTEKLYNTPELTIPMEKKGETSQGTDQSYSIYHETYNDIYTNIKNGYKSMQVGETVNLEGYRVAQTTIGDTDNKFIEPDMHYEILTGNDVISLEDAGSVGRPYQKMKALKEGTAVIKITYDEMNTVRANTYDGTGELFHSAAIDPENTGIVIVHVGGAATDNLLNGIDLTDYDTVYIPEMITMPDGSVQQKSNTVDYTFNPGESGVTVSLHAPLTTDSNWNHWTNCEKNEDGSYTLQLQAGRNIVKVSNGSQTAYKVIKAKKMTTTVTNETRKGKLPQAGDKVKVSFDGLNMPIYKMTAIYNPGYPNNIWIQYKKDNTDTIEGPHEQYKLSDISFIEFDVDTESDIKLSDGLIHCDYMGKKSVNHYSIPSGGRGSMQDAYQIPRNNRFLPDITIPVVGKEVGVMDLINEIDTENYLGCIDKIMEARDAYFELTEEERAKVTNADVLNTAYEAVKDIVELIESIDALPDEVTLDNQEAVEAANAAYTAMTPERQAAVSNADKLKNAVTVIQALLARQDRIQAVITQINALPETAKVTKADAEAIAAARAAYDALLPDEQDEVTNVAKLTETETQLGYVKAASTVMDAIAAIGDVTLDNYETKYELIVTARSAYDSLADGAKALVTNLDVLTKAEETYQVMDEDVKEVIDAIGKLKEPLTKSNTKMSVDELKEIWDPYTYIVVNIRGLADELTKEKQAIVTNINDLKTAEAYIQTIKESEKKDADQAVADEIAQKRLDNAKKLLDALPNAKDYTPTEGETANIPDEIIAEVATANAATADDVLSEEQKATLDPDKLKNLGTLVTLTETLAGYKDRYESAKNDIDQAAEDIKDVAAARQYVKELTGVYSIYNDKKVSRSDIAIIRQTIKAYDDLTDAQKDIIKNAEEASTITAMLDALKKQDEQVQKDEKAAAEVTEYIKNLPTSLNLDNMEAVRSDLQMIADKYNALNANAQHYVRMLSKVTATNNVLNTMTAEINTFRQGKPAVTAAATAYNSVTVSWNTYQYAQSYDVYRKTAGGEWTKLGNTTALQYVDQTAAGSTAYSYTVVALSSRWGQSVSSAYDENGAAVTTPAAPQPDNGNTTPDNGNTTPDNNNTPAVKDYTSLKATSAGVSSIKLSWKKVSKASGYVVYRANSANGKYKAIKTIKKGKTISFTDKKRTTGKTYYYKLRPYKTVKNKKQYMDYSSVVSTKAVPGRVKFTKLTAKNQKATLKWKKVSGASGYLLYRSDRRDGGFTCINSVSSRKTSYTNTKLKKGQTYYYRIRAYRKVGGKRVYGNFSVVKAVKAK